MKDQLNILAANYQDKLDKILNKLDKFDNKTDLSTKELVELVAIRSMFRTTSTILDYLNSAIYNPNHISIEFLINSTDRIINGIQSDIKCVSKGSPEYNILDSENDSYLAFISQLKRIQNDND